jgi:hypothetical protein
MRQVPDTTVTAVLEAARDRLSAGKDRVLGFVSEGIGLGTSLRLFLLSLSLGGKAAKEIVQHETTQVYVLQAKTLLAKNFSFPTHCEIVHAAYLSQHLGTLTGFARSEKGETSMFAAAGEAKKVLVEGADGEYKEIENKSARKQLMIGSKESAAFVRRRLFDVWCVFHGDGVAARWFLQLEKMSDDVLSRNVMEGSGQWRRW